MVTNITNLGRSGLSDWLIQRVSAIILALYTVFIVAYLLFNPGLDYVTWSNLFAQTWMRIFSLLAFISLAGHAWIGLWTVTTDYLKSASLRIGAQIVIILAIFVFLVWGIQVLWGA
ncbi:succinate dehydrogenase, hydrophobic membrane anchor protein [Halomonas sp. MCCC 1A17488]|uniref:Succinate dehydrogenase hydrophobic membrane anchor subunit n=1 Tax=Billgrantia sulfidoxydans TaxID=2733484 RepID=A0ABX7W1R8_9GAMM|nr:MULTISPECIES: succinate dehydrogenase, hydrophobic membrane anchor protein [Halomonas]MCE8015889.1 succinate dehydrogenase, hydrophobic membrane anchor protein [Halomonas sp. MCCC 1A17488]MCG3239222.1 succinate dehydrogenase, hydrophobic membrane anchor protein [Halomonas sp. MCCC 1A17488]QPP50843.1 succinate dehydrogenase, hydrophobic membrane anchor protein [Halomonas sp. SS10-MC5]QTP54368.1 succinate dehydrogenase, hydrophobic membrane anchor protein [Halomonas sulfidoxydans]